MAGVRLRCPRNTPQLVDLARNRTPADPEAAPDHQGRTVGTRCCGYAGGGAGRALQGFHQVVNAFANAANVEAVAVLVELGRACGHVDRHDRAPVLTRPVLQGPAKPKGSRLNEPGHRRSGGDPLFRRCVVQTASTGRVKVGERTPRHCWKIRRAYRKRPPRWSPAS